MTQHDPEVVGILETDYVKEHANQFTSLFESTNDII